MPTIIQHIKSIFSPHNKPVMKTRIELIPVLTKTATVEELQATLTQCRKPFLRRLAEVLKKPLAKRRDVEANIKYIVAEAEKDLNKVLDLFIKISGNRNKNLAMLNSGFDFLRKRLKEQFLKYLADGKPAEEAYDMACADTEETFKDELEEYLLQETA